jgi:hypothetical protein
MSKRRVKRTKGQGSVFLHPRSPYWQLSYWTGKCQVRESSHTRDHAKAVKVLQRKLADIAMGAAAGPEGVYVSALLDLVVDDYRRNDQADLHETCTKPNNA